VAKKPVMESADLHKSNHGVTSLLWLLLEKHETCLLALCRC
jgi:hypothetical protein